MKRSPSEKMPHLYSKVAVPGASSAAVLTAAAAAVVVALNSSRRRRREGGPDIWLGLGPGGRGGKRKPTPRQPRFPNQAGKRKWIMRPESSKRYEHYIKPENRELAAIPTTKIGKEFRHKFRMPFDKFHEIVEATRHSGLFPDEKKVQPGKKPHPLELKVMAAIRRLALAFKWMDCPIAVASATVC